MTDNDTHNYVNDLFADAEPPARQEAQRGGPTTEMLEPDHALKQFRAQLGLSQQDVAYAMGVSESSVNQIESNDLNDAKLDTLTSYVEGCSYHLELSLTPMRLTPTTNR